MWKYFADSALTSKKQATMMASAPTYAELLNRVEELTEALQTVKKLSQQYLDIANDLFLILNPQGCVTLINKKGCEILGYSEKEILGKNWFSHFLPKGIADDIRLYYRNIITGRTELSKYAEHRILTRNGQEKMITWHHTALKDKAGNVIGTLSSGEDITQRIQVEMEYKKLQAKLSSVINMAHLGPWEYDVTNDIFTFNDHFYKLFRTTASQVGGYQMSSSEYMHRFVHPEDIDLVVEEIRKTKETTVLNASRQIDHRILYADGSAGHISVRYFALKNAQGQIIKTYGVNQDITDHKRAEARIRENEEKLARSKKMESLGLLASGVAHDLNNILSGIVNYPELILFNLPQDSALKKPIETMQACGQRAAAIVQDLLTVARGVAIEKNPLNLNEVIQNHLKSPEYQKLLQYHPSVTVQVALDPDLPNIKGSAVHLEKAVMNLISNAAEAIDTGGSVAITTMNRYVDRPIKGYDHIHSGQYAVLSVEDDGPGISPNDIERIFEPFYTKKVMGRSGTGLGLAVVWNVVQDHKGHINMTTDDNGTKFDLYFPITKDNIDQKPKPLSVETYKGNGETILVVDDVESQREIACRMLEMLGYQAECVSSGEEAIAYLKQKKADMVLLDMVMDPGINGRETFEEIVKINPYQKTVIVSGFADTEDVKVMQQLGAGPYLKKPVQLEKIGLAIKTELEKKSYTV